MTAAGGTTLPASFEFCLNAACTPPYFDITIPTNACGAGITSSRCASLSALPIRSSAASFPAGGGGGVSIDFPIPPINS